MSLINQVLNELEKRGANGHFQDMPIRAVHAPRSLPIPSYVIVLIGFIVVASISLLAFRPSPKVVPAPALSSVSAVIAPQSLVLAAESAIAQSVVAESAVVAVEMTPLLEQAVASHLTFELSSIPLPNSLRVKPHPAPLPHKVAVASVPLVASSAPSAAPAALNKQLKIESPQQQAENEFRLAYSLAQQGQLKEAAAGYERALKLDATHEMARQSLVAVLLDSKQNAEAEKVLREALTVNPKQTQFAMLLARLQVERNALPLALETLSKTLPYAEQQADYQAFLAALLQRQSRHKEAISHYQTAVQASPNAGLWWMGLGISLQATQRKEEATDAFRHALASHTLSPELEAFVGQRLKELKR